MKIYWMNAFVRCALHGFKIGAVEDHAEGVTYAYCKKCKRRLVEVVIE